MTITCPFRKDDADPCPNPVRSGQYVRSSDGCVVLRFRCRRCKRSFSEATLDARFHQKKRHLNASIRRKLCNHVSLRDVARDLEISRTTVARKLEFLGLQARDKLAFENAQRPPATSVQFDDLETHEHTKLKPVSVTLMVVDKERRILGVEASAMAANGRLAEVSVKKYGKRKDGRGEARRKLFADTQPFIAKDAIIHSDENPYYCADVQTFFPHAEHSRTPGRKPRGQGYGEMKVGAYDPLFTLNHTFAMARYRGARLGRKTWCNTKLLRYLQLHLWMWADFHNEDVRLQQERRRLREAQAGGPV